MNNRASQNHFPVNSRKNMVASNVVAIPSRFNNRDAEKPEICKIPVKRKMGARIPSETIIPVKYGKSFFFKMRNSSLRFQCPANIYKNQSKKKHPYIKVREASQGEYPKAEFLQLAHSARTKKQISIQI